MKKQPFEAERVIKLLEDLAEEPPLALERADDIKEFLDSHSGGLGYSQMNELLLALGYDKISPEFFDFLCLGIAPNPQANSCIRDTEHLVEAVDRFQKLALYAFGNCKFAYKRFSRSPEELISWIDLLTPVKDTRYVHRLPPALPLKDIEPSDRYYLGYIVEREIRDRLVADPGNEQARAELQKRDRIVESGRANQVTYLTSDYLDVYVATSMRQRHEFLSVAQLTNQIFGHRELARLNLRYFDPTLAYCADRIDKGLSEALMLKRAKCTLFLAQESDTLGKDSELASTLAQGKPVIAYVPEGDAEFVDGLITSLESTYRGRNRREILLEHLMYYAPELAWRDTKVRTWLSGDCDEAALEQVFRDRVRSHYDSRAKTLRESHPLGIQVHLQTGVAVGVLVVRNIDDCAKLIRRIMLGEYVFKVEPLHGKEKSDVETHLALKEELSDSIFRVMTRDRALTHTFWNFYLR